MSADIKVMTFQTIIAETIAICKTDESSNFLPIDNFCVFALRYKDTKDNMIDELGDGICDFVQLVLKYLRDITSKEISLIESGNSLGFIEKEASFDSMNKSLYSLCDCLRICSRSLSAFDHLIDESVLELLLHIAERKSFLYENEEMTIPYNSIYDWSPNEMSIRCLINILFQKQNLIDLFCSVENNFHGLHRLIEILKSPNEPISLSFAYYCVKLLYMILSLRPNLLDLFHSLGIFEVLVVTLASALKASYSGSSERPVWITQEDFDLDNAGNYFHDLAKQNTDNKNDEDLFIENYTEILPFPFGRMRRELVKEICKLLYALKIDELHDVISQISCVEEGLSYEELVSILEGLICDVLLIPANDDSVFNYGNFLESFDARYCKELQYYGCLDVDELLNKLAKNKGSKGNVNSILSEKELSSIVMNGGEGRGEFSPSKLLERETLEVKKFAIQIALRLPVSSIHQLFVESHAYYQLCYFLGLQLKKAELITDISEKAFMLTPILMLLVNGASSNLEARSLLKSMIFPTQFDNLKQLVEAKKLTASSSEHTDKLIDPVDVPLDTIRGMLVRHMTSLDISIKRSVSEFIYLLCDENADEFVFRTGYGNAIALLKIKRLF